MQFAFFIVLYLCLVLLISDVSHGLSIRPSEALKSIVKLTSSSEYGLNSANNAAIIELIEGILRAGKQKNAAIEGCWDLIWTTEKETLFFARNGLFGRKCSSISQTITKETIFNTINFTGNSKFEVEGSVEQNDRRTNFVFRKAVLSYPPLPPLQLPPVGKGWFDTLYADAQFRVSADIRGDYLLSRRRS